ncbi:Ribonuclease H-like protein [Apiospora arundinis]
MVVALWLPTTYNRGPQVAMEDCLDLPPRLLPRYSSFVFVASTGKSITRHLLSVHRQCEPGTKTQLKRHIEQGIAAYVQINRHDPVQQALIGRVDNFFCYRTTSLLVLDWLVRENLPFHTVDSPAFLRVLRSLNPIASIPNSKTFFRLLRTEFVKGKESVRELLATARGMVHITFDGWTSRHSTSFIGVNVYFIDRDWKQWTFLLGLPPVGGRHRGIDIAKDIIAILEDFGLSSTSVGYATLDNASNNATCMQALAKHFGFDPAERHISCAPHTINLCTKAMMYGTKSADFRELLVGLGGDAIIDDDDEDDQVETAYFPAIENLLDHLELAMDGEIVEDVVGDDGRKMLAMVPIFDGLDNATIRLIKVYLRLAWSKLDGYYQRMTSLAYYAAVILHPCRKMAHLELLWKELPSRQSSQWVDDVLQRMRKMWEDIYANRELPQRDNVQREEERDLDFVTSRAVFLQKRKQGQNTLTSGPEAQQKRRKNARVTRHQAPVVDPIVEDELTRYLAESVCTLPGYVMDPIRWWREVGVLQYPRLSYMATDMLTIPSSTAETERQFNRTNRIITPLRLRLRRQAVGWAQSIASWSTAGVYTPQIPLHLLNGDEWEGLVRDTIFDVLDL